MENKNVDLLYTHLNYLLGNNSSLNLVRSRCETCSCSNCLWNLPWLSPEHRDTIDIIVRYLDNAL